mgnify:CR=1 FL=1
MTDNTLNQLAADAIKALAAFNAANASATKAWQASIKAGGYAAHFKQCPDIAEHLQIELLEEIVFYDDDAKGTLEEMRFQNSAEVEPAIIGRVRLSDVEFDYATSRGIA